jgi:AraC family transcriptional regulator, alkane utilization regulator
MSGTPPLLSETPPPTGMPDVLSDMLQTMRLTGAVFLNARFTAPFGVISPSRFDAGIPMASLRHISIFHLVVDGACHVEAASGEHRILESGDMVLMPFADAHKIWNGDKPTMASAQSIVKKMPEGGMWSIDHGGGGEETRVVCGFVESSEFLFTPIFRTLPRLMVERTGSDVVGSLLSSTVRSIAMLSETAAPGTQIALSRMMEMLFVELLRRHAGRLPEDSIGWFAALNDPVVSRALQLIHGDPARRWTADDLARGAGASKTVLAERFNELLGRPPIDYLTGWRIQIAANRLRSSHDSIANIAATAGYESEPAFSRAFKRVTGATPGKWRDGVGENPALMPIQSGQLLMPLPAAL